LMIVHSEQETTKHAPVKPNDANENSKKPKKNKRFHTRKWFIFFMLLFIIILGSIIYFVLSRPKMIHMPDVVNEEYDDAKETLEENQLKVNKKMMSSEEMEEGLVIKTDPEANRSVKEKSTVNIFVSEGKEKVKFGDYVGEKFGQTTRLLEEEGYKDVIDYPNPSAEPEGDIISQTEPNEGDEVVPAETKVIFEVSSGPETFTLM